VLAARLHAPNNLRLDEIPIPSTGLNQVLIRVSHSGICGSDLPRIFEQGTYHFPTIPGHEFAGEIAQVGGNGKADGGLREGLRVAVIPLIPCGMCRWCTQRLPFHCEHYDFLGSRSDGGFAEFALVPHENVMPVPDSLPMDAAAMAEPIAVACHCVRSADIKPGDVVVVFGAGAIGNFSAQWARHFGASAVYVVDIRSEALKRVEAVGLIGIDGFKEDAVKRFESETKGIGADVVIEASGSPKGLFQAIDCVRRRGALALIGRIDRDCTIPGNSLTSILRKEIAIRGIWGFNHWQFPHNDWELALRALAEARIIVEPLITHRFPLKEIHRALEMMRSGKEYYCKVLIEP